jgi:phospholipid transport system substrate-binding protein
MKRIICIWVLTAALVCPAYARAATPLKTVEDHVHQLLGVLSDRSLTGPAGEEKKRDAARSISGSLFDFTELSRFTLGAGWRAFTPQQRKTFVDLYRQLLESIYMGRLLQYRDQKVDFKRQFALSDTRWEVQSEIITKDGNIPMDYRLIEKNGAWKVYDVIIENVSLARNYRSQFRSILSDNTPEQLLDILRQKIKSRSEASR